MFNYLKNRKREREIVHNCMEYLAESKEIELTDTVNSICKCYEALERSTLNSRLSSCFFLLIINLFISIFVLVINFFW